AVPHRPRGAPISWRDGADHDAGRDHAGVRDGWVRGGSAAADGVGLRRAVGGVAARTLTPYTLDGLTAVTTPRDRVVNWPRSSRAGDAPTDCARCAFRRS